MFRRIHKKQIKNVSRNRITKLRIFYARSVFCLHVMKRFKEMNFSCESEEVSCMVTKHAVIDKVSGANTQTDTDAFYYNHHTLAHFQRFRLISL